jgi:Helix-hairpin-helix domain
MTTKHLRAEVDGMPSGADDLKLIDGIGPAIERHLYNAGILTFAQIADLSPEELAALLHAYAGLSAQQIAKRDWIGQARQRASTATLGESRPAASKPASTPGQVTFKVQLRVDGNNNVRGTHVTYVQDGSEEKWAGWNESKLVDFFVRHAALHLPAAEPVEADAVAAEPPNSAAPIAKIGGMLRLNELVSIDSNAGDRSWLPQHGQPFVMRLALDLGKVIAPCNTALGYRTTIYARRLSTGSAN